MMPNPKDLMDPYGIYATQLAPSDQNGQYKSYLHDHHYEVDTGWIDIPVAYNNAAAETQEHTVRIKLYQPQYRKVVKYQATRETRPPMVPDLDNTNKSTLNPTSTSLTAAGQQPPVLHGFSYVVSAPFGTGQGQDSTWKTELVATYSVAKEKLFLEMSDVSSTGLADWSTGTIKTQFYPKAPIDSNSRQIPANIIADYVFTASTGPGMLVGGFTRVGNVFSNDPYRGF